MEEKIAFRDLLAILSCDVMLTVIDPCDVRSVSVSMFVDDWYEITHDHGDRYVSLISAVKADEIYVILAAREGEAYEDPEST